AAGPAADAEVLAAACSAVDQAGLKGCRLVLGHLGAVLQLLEQLGLDEHGQNLILSNMESLARRGAGPDEVIPRVLALMGVGDGTQELLEEDDETASLLPSLLSEFGSE